MIAERLARLYAALGRDMELYISNCLRLAAVEDEQFWTREAMRAEQNKNRFLFNIEKMISDEANGEPSVLITNGSEKVFQPAVGVANRLALLQAALLAAFDEAGLRQMVRYELDADLDAIAGGATLQERVFALIAWAVRTNRVAELIAAAQEQNPTNEQLKAL